MAGNTVDIRTKNLTKPVDVADYLFTRLHQIGVRSVHGLPGDYNLVALDYLPQNGLKWVGSVNELNAAYAADGYARIKGISALITTFGVGELSALNGVAGAYSEMVPVVHIVGCPSTISQRNGMLLHHTLGNGDFGVFAEMSKAVSCEVAKLTEPAEIAAQIDHALRECYLKSRPVYIMWPTDRVTTKVEGARLDTPIDLREPENEAEREDYVVDVVLRYLHKATNPVLLVDACAIRHRVLDEVHALIEKTKIPVFVTPMGKGAIDETHETFGGVYAGDASHPDVKEAVESSDLVLTVGALKSDFNTAGFSYRLSQMNTVDFHSTYCAVRYSEYPGVKMRGVLKKVTDRVDIGQLSVKKAPKPPQTVAKATGDNGPVTQAWFWPRITEFLKDDDIVVTETGTANFGIWDTKFPKGATGLNQTLWGSIGWAVGACQGAALGAKDAQQQRRTILFEGDGSFQLTAQELSTMIKHELDVIIFVICNDGYTIERFIHGMEAEYNDVVQWDYKELVTVFSGGPEKQAKNGTKKYTVKTKDEVEKLFADKDFNERKGLRFVEIYMPKEDAPRSLQTTAEASARNNAKSE
ncbi:Pyruvate decarboxylase [Pestalotiopsis fici W106-1]|uniref:Pyruvate decarboxylase n=1 Tax=Pestalotiopsis fici (strain W106-1 / CGMCC3.15140) TaxID=1229662 RepID=W3XHK5_PESFW|nr:Pyruvate decarboxylase [Pestalotiopsis fici W106-1]ETS85515.1 Pyruvate decarboxylase [Pestalotiopsis fici W106-1]